MSSFSVPGISDTALHLITSKDGGIILDSRNDRSINLNPTALKMLTLLKEGKTEAEVARSIALEYEIDEAVAAEDLQTFLQMLTENAISVEEVQAPQEYPISKDKAAEPSQTFPWYGKDGVRLKGATAKRWTIFKALAGLAIFDLILVTRSFSTLCSIVQRWSVHRQKGANDFSAIREICNAVDWACVWYPKKALCLQRSAVTTCLLRSAGIRARMVVGAHVFPFSAHAWVETDSGVINDFPGIRRFYQSFTSY